jgi:cellulose synthase operon protein C
VSDVKKTPQPGVKGVFGDTSSVREALPTEAEGDALLDMLFDDAPRATPVPEPAPAAESAPALESSAEATPIPSADAAPAAVGAEVAAPPGWAITPSPRPTAEPRAYRSAPPPDLDDDLSSESQPQSQPRSQPLGQPQPKPSAPLRIPPPAPPSRSMSAHARPTPREMAVPSADDGFGEMPTRIATFDPAVLDAVRAGSSNGSAAAPSDAAAATSGPESEPPTMDFDDEPEDATMIAPPVELAASSAEAAPGIFEESVEQLADESAEPVVDDSAEEVDASAFDDASYDEPQALLASEPSPARPVTVPPRAPMPTEGFGDERDASLVLVQSGQRDSFVARAEWMREEAQLHTDKLAKARLLLVVSELYALCGEDELSAEVAREAFELAPNLPSTMRQHRSLLVRSGDWESASEVIDAEIRLAPTAEGRAHASWFAAEVARVSTRDEALAKRRAEQTARAVSSDPRPLVQRFVESLAQGAELAQIARVKPSDPQSLTELSAAFASVLGVRGAARAVDEGSHPAAALAVSRQALSAGDRSGALDAFAMLGDASLAGASAWLRASLSMARSETRKQASPLLRRAAQGTNADEAARMLAGLAVECGESVDIQSREAFSALDQLALSALIATRSGPEGRASQEVLPNLVDEASAAGDEALAVLALAVTAAVAEPGVARLSRLRHAGGSTPSGRPSVVLARVLGAARGGAPSDAGGPDPSTAAIDASVSQLSAIEGGLDVDRSALVRALSLELDIESGAVDRVASAVASLGGESERDATAELASALLSEAAGELDRARESYQVVHEADPSNEAAVRALASGSTPDIAAVLVQTHAAALADGPAKGVLETEVALRWLVLETEQAHDASEAAARRAAELLPSSPIATHLGELAARTRGDQDALLGWLRFRIEHSDDPIERAYDLTREALLSGEGASTNLEQAMTARPDDFCLRELYERLAPEPPEDRAAWREARLEGQTGEVAARLAIEAALDFERSGDVESALRCARAAEAAGERDLAPLALYRCALAGHGTAELVDALLPLARASEDPAERLELYERLAELDERGRDDSASGLLFRRSILEENPGHLRTLRRVASALMSGNREEELEPIALELARQLDGTESVGWAALSFRLAMRTRWEDTYPAVEAAYAHEPRPGWVLRQMAAHARARGDLALSAACDRELIEHTDRPLERATLTLRAAEDLRATAANDEAKALLADAAHHAPGHVLVRLELADLLEQQGDPRGAAAHLEAASEAISSTQWRKDLELRAAVLWMDQAGDRDRARDVLERVAAVDPNDLDVFERLRRIYVESGARSELAELLRRRLDAIEDPGERVEMEVMRGRALAEVGDADAAKRALAAALDASPDHVDALSAFADLCYSDGDYEGAEQALIRLARLSSEPDRQIDIYFRLGELYDDKLPNDERAEAAYQEILKRRPSELTARAALISLYRRTHQFPRALEEQNELVNVAESPEDKCQRSVELAEILEEMGELKKAESSLVVARKSFPKSDLALRALVRFYQRTGQAPAAAVLLDRAVADARRALGTGRFETFLFETLATAAELRGRGDAAQAATATVRALEGYAVEMAGAGVSAGDAALDELLAPEVMTPAFRELLLRSGPMLDAAYPYDLDGVRALPLPPPMAELGEEAREIAGAYGLPQIQILVSNVLGPIVVPARANPPTLVVGQALAAQGSTSERSFLLHRAMKVLQANACVFARTAPIDLWPLLAGFLKVFYPQFAPQGVDAGRFNEAFGRLSRALPPGLPQDTSVLAADIVGTIGNRASTLNSAINGWGSRAGLLAVGDPNVALMGIAWAGGNLAGPPADGKDRLTWIGRNAEARDLVVFSVSDTYVDARSRLGLG